MNRAACPLSSGVAATPARLEVRMRDVPWDVFYAPIARIVGFVAERLNTLQFLTIRGYLTLVFGAPASDAPASAAPASAARCRASSRLRTASSA